MDFSSAWTWLKKHPFWFGFIAGPAWILFLVYVLESLHVRAGSFLDEVAGIFAWPADLFMFIFGIFDYLCPLLPPDSCRGLGLDGGPIEWVEWVIIFLQFALGYGLLFWVSFNGWKLGKKYLIKKKK